MPDGLRFELGQSKLGWAEVEWSKVTWSELRNSLRLDGLNIVCSQTWLELDFYCKVKP